MEKGMKESNIEGVATRGGPESCVGVREGAGEALTGVRVGWAIEPRNQRFGVPTPSRQAEGNTASSVHTGAHLPAYCTAMGKLLMANLHEGELRELLSNAQLARRAANTITSKAKLREQLDEIRELGFATSDQELAPGLLAIAAPVRDQERE
jgi:Bacterial transcriptional regulator